MKNLLALALATAPAFALSFSFAGEWTFSYDATLHIQTPLLTQDIVEGDSGVTLVTQTVIDEFEVPYAIGPVTGNGSFEVNGLQVRDTVAGGTTPPITVDTGFGVLDFRMTYSAFDLTGTITGINSGVVDGFGEYAYEITGDPLTLSNVLVEVNVGGTWVDLGSDSSVEVTQWSMVRPDPVPEPASLAVLGGAAALAALRKRRTR